MKLRTLRLFIPMIMLAAGLYFAACLIVYNQLASVLPECTGEFGSNTPAGFTAERYQPGLDTSPYFMPVYESIQIPSRDPGITLSAWFIPAENTDAPAVLITHGVGVGTPDCKRNPRALLAAGMLHRAGYNTLVIDVREHGDSTIEDGLWAANTEEYLDVLGAWDWLVTARGFAPERIGLFGYSGGTGASLIAMSEEPRIRTAWLDSVYTDTQTSIADRLVSMGLPAFLTPGGMMIARLHGDDMFAYSPLMAAAKINGRQVLITHSTDDPVLPVEYAYNLEAALRANGTTPELWIVQGSAHVRYLFEHTAEYEQRLIEFFDQTLS